MPYFKGGLFARNGWLNFWIEFLIWFFFIAIVTLYVFKAIRRLEHEHFAKTAKN
jgi:hypothetical protein